MADRSLHQQLAAQHQALRHAWIARHVLRATAASAVLIALAVAIGAAFAGGTAAAWLRLTLLAIALLGALAWAVRATLARTPAFDRYLEIVEQHFPQVRSWLRNALDLDAHPPRDTSAELALALQAETVRRLADVPVASLAPPLELRRPGWALAAAGAAVVLLALLAPARTQRSWATLWNPAAAAPPVELSVEPGSVRVTPGAMLAVRARVRGTTQAPRLLREDGRPLAAVAEGDGASGERRWRFDLTQLTRETEYRVRVASVESPRYRITLDGTPAPLSFDVAYTAPGYARLPLQRGATTRGELSALRGTRASIEVTFDRDLESLDATRPDGRPASFTALSPRRWKGEIPLDREGEWSLHAHAAGGEGRYRYAVKPLADAPPLIAVRVPETDLNLPTGQLVPLDVVGQDDLGLSELQLEYRKGPDQPWKTTTLSRFPQAPREARVESRWDASTLGLLPGEVASFRFVLFDDNAFSGRGKAVSQTFELRFPSLADLYEQVDDTHADVQTALEKAAEKAKELQKSLEKLERQQAVRSPMQTPNNFERSEELKRAMERQQDLSQQLEKAAQDLRQSLEQAAERKAYDEQLMRKLKEMAELMQQIQSPELKKAMERMQKAMEDMEPRAGEQDLPKWKEQNKEMLENLQRSIELLKQLREEEQLAALAERAEELKREQDALNQQHAEDARTPLSKPDASKPRGGEQPDSKANASEQNAEAQEQMAEKTEQLARDAKEMAEQMDSKSEQESLESAAQELQQNAAQQQREAAEMSQQQKSQKAQQAGQQASQSLSKAQQQMQQMMSQRSQQRDGADLAAVRRAAQDLVSLQRSAQENMTSGRTPAQRADRQTDLAEGVARVADSLSVLAAKTPFISPQLSEALGRAMSNLQNSGRDLSAGNRQRAEALGEQGSDALNEAVLELRDTEASMCQMPGAGQSGKVPSPASKMGQIGDQQGQLNQQTRSIARKLSQQMDMTSGDQQELQRLATEQARIRQQVEALQQQDERADEQKLLGKLDRAQTEMQEVEEALRSGHTSPDLEEKQQRILSRMLDAQRSVHRRDFDPEREARAGDDASRPSPAELPADLLQTSDRLRLDLLKSESDRYPAQYRAFIESYLRSLNGQRR